MEPYMWADLLDEASPSETHMTTKDVPLAKDYCTEYVLLTEDDLLQLRTGHLFCVEINDGEYTLIIGMAGD